MTTKINEALELGHQIWLDNLSRSMLRQGELEPWLEMGVTGITTNPSIFQKSLSNKDLYPSLSNLPPEEPCAPLLLDAICEDVAEAADKLRPLYDASHGARGFVSIELNPHFADDVAVSLQEAALIARKMGDRPNYTTKVAANEPGLEIMRELLIRGINVNMTLIFAVETISEILAKVREANDERIRAKAPGLLPQVVMSFFVSRLDAAIDPLLEKRKRDDLMGEIALALAHTAVIARDEILSRGGPWKRIVESGRAPKLLWASTGAKNPAYSKTRYVERLIIADTIDTVPDQVLGVFLEGGEVKENRPLDRKDEIRGVLEGAQESGVDAGSIARKLFDQGLRQFQDAYDAMIAAVRGDKADPAREIRDFKNILSKNS